MTNGLQELKNISDVRMNQKVLIINTKTNDTKEKIVEKIETAQVYFGKYDSFIFGSDERIFVYDEDIVKILRKLKEKQKNDMTQLIENGVLIHSKLEAVERLGQQTIEKVKKKVFKYIKEEVKELARKRK